MTGKIKIAGLYIILVLIAITSKSQNKILPKEDMQIHLSEKCLFPGETLWLSVYVSNQKDLPGKQISNLAFVEFIDKSNTSLVRKKLILKEGVGHCSVSVPDTLSTGICAIMVYTNWMKNFGESSYSKSKVLVFNPNSDFTEDAVDTTYMISGSDQSNTFELGLSKSEYRTREKVVLNLDNENLEFNSAHLSVSVRQKEPEQILNLTKQDFPVNPGNVQDIIYLPDYKGVLFSGRLVSKSGSASVADKEIIMSFPGEFVDLKYAQTNEKGDFNFLLEPKVGEMDLVLQLPTDDYLVRLNDPFENGMNDARETEIPSFGKKTALYLKDRYIKSQLRNRFNQKNVIEAIVENEEEGADFFGEPYQTVKLRDYNQLDSLAEYFYELIPTVHFSNRKGRQQLYLTNPETNFKLGDNPMVFVDGVFYPGLNELASLDHNLVSEISVVPKVYYYRDKTLDGIVSVKTRENNFNQVQQLSNMVRLIYPVSNKMQSFKPIQNPEADRIPDLRTLLHWQDNISLDSINSKEITFYTSDSEGEFIISICGMTDKGEFINFEKTFVVSD